MNVGRIIAAAVAAIGAGGAAALAYTAFRDRTADDDNTGESLDAAPVAQAEASTLGARAVEELAYHLGEHGGPKGSATYHRGKFIDETQRGRWDDAGDKLLGLAWCARAVRWAYEEAAADLGLPKPFPSKLGTLAMAESWKKSPFDKYALSSAKVGAVWVVKTSAGFHTGLVAKVLGPLTIVTIEGNHGDAVASVKRTLNLDVDALVDVETWVHDQGSPAVVGLDYFAVEA